VQVILPVQEHKYKNIYNADERVAGLAYLSHISDHLKEVNTKIQGTIKNILSSMDKPLVSWRCDYNLLPMIHYDPPNCLYADADKTWFGIIKQH
jgi:hypothetical protein